MKQNYVHFLIECWFHCWNLAALVLVDNLILYIGELVAKYEETKSDSNRKKIVVQWCCHIEAFA